MLGSRVAFPVVVDQVRGLACCAAPKSLAAGFRSFNTRARRFVVQVALCG